jgi:chromosome segregation protein
VEKQRGTLKRQAAKARRYSRLRDELRRWEKVLFARRYRALADAIDTARTRLADARENETSAAARLAEVENTLSALRIEQAEADAVAGRLRDEAHARELDINRRQQQIALDKQQASMLETRASELDQERQQLEARREPERLALDGRRRPPRTPRTGETRQPAWRGPRPRTTHARSRRLKRSSRTSSAHAPTSTP